MGDFHYDANGNLSDGAGRIITWNSFDMPVQITKGGISSHFVYGSEHQRLRQDRNDGSKIIYAGQQEVEVDASGKISVKTYWPSGLGLEIDRPGSATELNWVHKDRLGSPVAITDQSGNLKEKLAYDAWGKRRSLDGSSIADSIVGVTDNKGFTGHEMLEALELVHMNGRVYDPLVGRFMSGDPLVQDPTNGQNYNRYSYVLNNPTNLTDPTGFSSECTAPTGSNVKTDCPTKTVTIDKDKGGNITVTGTDKNGRITATGSVNPGGKFDNQANSVKGGKNDPPHATKTGGTDSRPDKCDMVCINQSTFEATPRTFHSGDFAKDMMNAQYSQMIAGGINALHEVGHWWTELTLLGLGGADAEGAAVVAKKTEYLYRGVSAGHPALEAALKGRAVPGNVLGKVTEEAHNLGGVAAESQFTSWTRSFERATEHANKNGPGGVILQAPVGAPPKGASWSWSWSWSWSPDIYHESEVLLRGVRDGLKRIFP